MHDVKGRPHQFSFRYGDTTDHQRVRIMKASNTYLLHRLLELICKWTLEYETVPAEHPFHDFCLDLLGIGNNCSVNGTSPPPLEPVEVPKVIQDVLLVLYLIVMAGSLLGNVAVLLVLGLKKRVRLLSAAYIMSLSASGVLMAILAVPTDIMAILTSYSTRDNFFSSHMSGDVMCKFVSFFKDLVKFANVLTATGLSIERYLAVVHPLKARSLQPTVRTVTSLILIWSISTVLALPSALLYAWVDINPSLGDSYGDTYAYSDLVRSMGKDMSIPWYTCSIEDTVAFQAYHCMKLIMMLIVPTLAMAFSYICIGFKLWTRKRTSTTSTESDTREDLRVRTARRVTATMVITMVLFLISWGPYVIYELLLVLWSIQLSPFTLSLYYFSSWLLLSHSAYNPLLHTFLHDNFRRNFADVLLCRHKRIFPKTDAVPSAGNQPGNFDSSDPRPPTPSCSELPLPYSRSSDNFLATPSTNHLLAPSPVKIKGKPLGNGQ